MPWWGFLITFLGGGLWSGLCILIGAAITAGNRKTITIPDDPRGLD